MHIANLMDRTALHLELRNGLEISDELRRHEHALENDGLAARLSALHTMLDELEREIGQTHVGLVAKHLEAGHEVRRLVGELHDRRSEVPLRLRRRLALLVATGRRIAAGLTEPDARVRSKPVAGILPVARLIPQDVHSVVDYLASAATLASAFVARTKAARFVGANLGSTGGALSKLTDQRLSVVKVIPIETHEGLDYLWGAVAIASPFVFGYAKKDRLASTIQMAAGVGTILSALFTDYRASKGVTSPHRSRGGPTARRLPHMQKPPSEASEPEVYRVRMRRVQDVQRPLEGLSSAPTDWRPDADGKSELP